MKEIFQRQNLPPFLATFLLICNKVSADIFQKALFDESGMI
jgi:hypothetical protein